ncbi:fumarylacetoacetate hydrolase, partial [Psychrobacter sanguinis]|nr:fumarylacetoacetate hydrolase [Psychrobacter sanguinis]
MNMKLNVTNTLPTDSQQGCLIGRVWRADKKKPVPVLLRNNEVIDISSHFPTVAQLLENSNPVSILANLTGEALGTVEELLDNTHYNEIGNDNFHFLSPIDLQVIKAAGVTFASSMIERVIEEKAGGDAAKAKDIRNQVNAVIGNNLRDIVPGSEKAQKLKDYLISNNMWSQYLEVGIGVDAE